MMRLQIVLRPDVKFSSPLPLLSLIHPSLIQSKEDWKEGLSSLAPGMAITDDNYMTVTDETGDSDPSADTDIPVCVHFRCPISIRDVARPAPLCIVASLLYIKFYVLFLLPDVQGAVYGYPNMA